MIPFQPAFGGEQDPGTIFALWLCQLRSHCVRSRRPEQCRTLLIPPIDCFLDGANGECIIIFSPPGASANCLGTHSVYGVFKVVVPIVRSFCKIYPFFCQFS